MNQQKRPFYSGLIHGIPIGLGYLAVSFTFGIMAVSSGLSVFQSVLISLTNLTSAGQFAGLGIITCATALCPAPFPRSWIIRCLYSIVFSWPMG